MCKKLKMKKNIKKKKFNQEEKKMKIYRGKSLKLIAKYLKQRVRKAERKKEK